jgi:hypothetical protein
MSTSQHPTSQLTAPKLRKRPRLSLPEPYEEQGARFVQGCEAARQQTSREFPSGEELESMEAMTSTSRRQMEEVHECVSRAKRILYAMQENCKTWDFEPEDIAHGRVQLVPNSFSIEQIHKAIDGLQQTTLYVQNALGTVTMEEEKQRSLRWVEEERALRVAEEPEPQPPARRQQSAARPHST